MPWSAMRLGGIFEDLTQNPGYTALMEARLARQCLSQFWLSAPVDQLEVLYRSADWRVLSPDAGRTTGSGAPSGGGAGLA